MLATAIIGAALLQPLLISPSSGFLIAASQKSTRSHCLLALNRKQRRQHLQPPGTPPPPPAQPATTLAPATCAGVEEDHAFEQFFFDEPTRAKLLAILTTQYERPLLLCAPSLAVAAEAAGVRYLLLDRDERFAFLSGFRSFDLDSPSAEVAQFADGQSPDVVLCDPPFANFPLARLRAVIDLLAPAVPLYLCFNGRREEEVAAAFQGRSHGLERVGSSLGYDSVKKVTQNNIALFGPVVSQS